MIAKKPQARPAPPAGPNYAFIADDATKAVVDAVLAEQSGSPISEPGGIGAALKRLDHDVASPLVIVDISGTEDGAGDVADLMSVVDPATRVIVIGDNNDVPLFRSLLSVGVADYLVKPLEKRALRNAINAALRPPGAAEQASKQGKVTAFFATRGGLGSTSIAVNTAALISTEWSSRVALVDLDLQFGTVALALGLEPAGGLREALERPERIELLFLERAMTKYSENLHVLGAEEPLSQNFNLDPAALRALVTTLQNTFDVVIIDLPRGMGRLQRHVLSLADHVVIVTELSLAGVRDCLRIKNALKEMDTTARPIYVASASRGTRLAPVNPNDFKETVGERIAVVLPSDEKGLASATSASKTLSQVAKTSPFLKALRPLAGEISGKKVVEEQEPGWRRFLRKQAPLKPAKA